VPTRQEDRDAASEMPGGMGQSCGPDLRLPVEFQ
jgi:hypothetical protein